MKNNGGLNYPPFSPESHPTENGPDDNEYYWDPHFEAWFPIEIENNELE